MNDIQETWPMPGYQQLRTAWGIGELAALLGPRHPDEPPPQPVSFFLDKDHVIYYYHRGRDHGEKDKT